MGEIAPAVILEALYAVCGRLEAEGVLARMHPVWDVSGVAHSMASTRRHLAGQVVAPTGATDLRIAIGAAQRSGVRVHAGPCPPAPVSDGGDIVIDLFDPSCGSLCPWAFATREDYVAHRILPAIAQAAGRSPLVLARLVGVATPAWVIPGDVDVRPLADTLFG